MATEPVTPTAPLPALHEVERAEESREAQRSQLREAQLRDALKELDGRHQEERRVLYQELGELAVVRKAVQDQVWAGCVEPGRPKQQDGASSSAAGAALNGEDRPGEGDEEIPNWAKSLLKVSQQRDKEKQALSKERLPERNELHVEVQRLLEVLDEKELRKSYDYRTKTEDPRKVKAYQRTLAAKQAGLWRFVSKKKVEAKRKAIEQKGTAKDDIDYVDNQLGYPRLPDCYEEIKRLLDIEKNPIFSKALQEWNRKEELFSRRVERKKNRVADLKNEVYQLIGFFSVFQGVVLTAVSQSSFLYCHNKWSPISLSVLASVISTFGVIQKLNQINALQRNVDLEERSFTAAVQAGQRIRDPEPGKGIDFSELGVDIEQSSSRKSKLSRKEHRDTLYYWLVIFTLLAFGVLFPVSFWSILCRAGSPPGQ